MKIEIRPIADHPELHDMIASWLWTEWGTPTNRGLYGSLVAHSGKDTVPVISVVFAGAKPVGTVGLLRTDLLSRQEFTPWMAVLYVVPEYRGQGIAARLQDHVIAQEKRLGFHEMYLYPKMSGFYEMTGWVFLENDLDDHGGSIRVYRKDL